MGKVTTRLAMPVRMRAKQFAMFDALKGLTEAIADKERCCDPRRELSEERMAELDMLISSLQVGITVNITYYCSYSNRYKRMIGIVNKKDFFWKQLLVEGIVIDFCDIYDIAVDSNIGLSSIL